MSLNLVVNGKSVKVDIEPRTHLADFLRESLHLTGTHLGCEHGVCGACTLLVDGQPTRSCITFAAACSGRSVCSIEGLEDDPVTAALRQAFTAEHALQCGFCTPGMLMTARDIVLHLPDADDDRVRLELAGNLCRCTGYNGIVRAIRRVLDQRLGAPKVARPALARVSFGPVEDVAPASAPLPMPPAEAPAATADGKNVLRQILTIGLGVAEVWAALRDPGLIAGCVPGAKLDEAADGRLAGTLTMALGPIQGRFTGTGSIRYDDAGRAGVLNGEGRDRVSATRLSAEARFSVTPAGASATRLEVVVTYALRGPLAQFGRGPVVQVFAAEIAAQVGRNLEARLKGETMPDAPASLSATSLAGRVFLRWLKGLFGRG